MFRIFTRVQLTYLGVFVLVCAGLYVYEAVFVWPAQRCEANGAWWNAHDRECDTPIEIWRITGRGPHTLAAPGALRPAAVPPTPAARP